MSPAERAGPAAEPSPSTSAAPTAAGLPARARPLIERLARRAFDADTAAVFVAALADARWEQAEARLDAPDPSGARIASLIDRVVRGIERGGRQWTLARRKDSLQRVLEGSRGDAARLQQRLGQLLNNWDSDGVDAAADVADVAAELREPAAAAAFADASMLAATPPATPPATSADAPDAVGLAAAHWTRVVGSFDRSLRQALPLRESTGRELAEAIAHTSQRLQVEGARPELADELEALCGRADWVLQHRQHLMDQLGSLCFELTDSLTDLAEDDSWARGQCEAIRARLDDGLTARGVKSISELLRTTRERQAELRVTRDGARQALKSMIHDMLAELGELGQQTGRFQDQLGRYASVVEEADSLESLADVVREMVVESRAVHDIVSQARQRLSDEHGRASALTEQVEHLEAELRRLSNEVSTDPLTQIANRRGLTQAFDAERARSERGGAGLAIGLLDIDNFKRLNDELGHAAGDEALTSLAAVVSRTLRPTDVVARYGGEEFVLLLPDTPLDEAQLIITRLQRALSGGLFMHEQKKVLVTFSAGITSYREGERLEDALERADQGLYEAKRTGKNRTCVG